VRSTFRRWNNLFSKLQLITRHSKRRPLEKRFARYLRLELMEDRRMLATLTVNSLADTHINTDGVLTLREAVEVVQLGDKSGLDSLTATNQVIGTLGSSDTINFASTLNGGTITLSLLLGEIGFSKSLTIDASGLNNGITVNGNDPTPGHTGSGIRIFSITDTSTAGIDPPLVEIVGLTLKKADAFGDGGAIYSQGKLVIRDCNIIENQADRGAAVFVNVAGGGATSRNVLTIENCDIEDNEAFNGAGVYVVAGGADANTDIVAISGGTITNNTGLSSASGGGIYAELYGASMTISSTSLTLNEAANGGAIYAQLSSGASLHISGATITDNDAGYGAGIYATVSSASIFSVDQTTIHDNEAGGYGGGLYVNASDAESLAELSATTIDNNESASSGGGIYAVISSGARLTLNGSTLQENTASTMTCTDRTMMSFCPFNKIKVTSIRMAG
jgi:predicted outer membrane repeat protein